MINLYVQIDLSRTEKPNSYLCYNKQYGKRYKKVTIHQQSSLDAEAVVAGGFAFNSGLIPSQKDIGT
tara:strand:+ start:1078 stop:1278 length:201 start_codon:yes stop_codon:yes gene_type:complete